MAFCKYLFAALIFFGSQGIAQAENNTIRLSLVNLPPVSTPARDGYLDTLLVELFQRVDKTVAFVKLPSARSLPAVDNGTVDGDGGRLLAASDGFSDIVTLGAPLLFVDFGGFYTNPEITLTRIEDFQNYRVGYIRGWQIAERLFGDNKASFAARKPDNLFDLLDAGRIDIVFMTHAPGLEILAAKNMHAMFSDYRVRHPLHLHLNSRFAELMPDLERALDQMLDDGTYDRITQNYASKH